jgi:hypothetical protein
MRPLHAAMTRPIDKTQVANLYETVTATLGAVIVSRESWGYRSERMCFPAVPSMAASDTAYSRTAQTVH